MPGETATFSVTAGGQGPFAYQWRFEGADLLGATNSTLVLLDLTTNHHGHYSVRVSSLGGEILSESALLQVLVPENVLCEPDPAKLQLMLRTQGTNIFGFDGTIVLRDPLMITRNTALNGYGRKIVISGNKAVRAFEVAPGVTFALSNLEVRDGFTNQGAAICCVLQRHLHQ
jgi:hypothetical protein